MIMTMDVLIVSQEDRYNKSVALDTSTREDGREGAGYRKVIVDRDFLCRLRDGDQQAFETLYLKYMPAIRKFLTVLTRSDDAGHEIAQDVFVRLWKRLKYVDPDKDIGNYLYKIARNEAFRHLDGLKRVKTEYFAAYEQQYEDTGAIPDQEYIAREMELIVDIAVSRMSPRQRSVYELSRKEKMNNTDIAKLLNISKNTVENHITTALNDIRKVYAKYAHATYTFMA
jgi:RNA polymerase sigma-70 factor (ECF subfamily)